MADHHTDARPPRRFRWRVVPAAFVLIFGGLMVLAGVFSLGAAMFALFHPAAPAGQAILDAGRGLNVFGGLLWLASSRWCLHGRWTLAIITAIAGYAYSAVIFALFGTG